MAKTTAFGYHITSESMMHATREDVMKEIIGLTEDHLTDAFVELIRRVSSRLPEDVTEALKRYRDAEEEGSRARRTMDTILVNAEKAEAGSRPICQDTGTVTFDIYCPFGVRESAVKAAVERAVVDATEKHYLRPNVVDSMTGASKADNIGRGHPLIKFHQIDEGNFRVVAVLKGGGCENVGAQYTLPDTPLKAGRDINGVKKVVLDAVVKASGKGCAPGVLGIGIGGDRATSYLMSKETLHRRLDDVNPDPALAELESWVVEKANSLGIGPMGFGGKTTLFGAKAGVVDRIPASFYVAVTYMCWAYRRRVMNIVNGEVAYD